MTNQGNFNPSKLIGPLSKDFKNIDKVAKSIKETGFTAKHFYDASKSIASSHSLAEFGIKIGTQLTGKIIQEGISSLSSSGSSSIPFLSHNSSRSLTNKGTYKKTIVHIGRKPSSRIIEMRNNTNVDYDEKSLINTELDFQDSGSRKLLTLKAGFNEKSIGFFMENSYLSAERMLTIYNQNNRAEKTVNKNKTGLTELYGCVYKTKTKLKFINRFQFYNVSIIIHLVKITDIQTDPRSLLESTTTKLGKKRKLVVENGVRSYTEIDGLDESDYNSSKIKFDEQYSAPYQKDSNNDKNPFLETFLTSVNCQLTDSAAFNNKALICETWRRTLTPGSIWDFNLEHHLKRGIHINKLIDFTENNNKNHPVGYVYIIEYLGDFKGKIIKNKNQDFYQGFSPSKIHLEYEHQICYLTELNKIGEEIPIFYTKKRKAKDFEEGSELEKIFTPKRKSKLHIAYDNISMSTEKKNKLAEYTLEDGEIADNSIMQEISDIFKNAGLESIGLVEDDSKYASEINKTEMPDVEPHHNPPTDDDDPDSIDLDK
jgi:hypothetical protein